jgi:hypothetical protein
MLTACGCLSLLLGGCGGNQDEPVRDVATDFYAAVQDHDGPAACALLAPTTRDQVAQTTGKPCAEGLFEEDVPDVRTLRQTAVYGTMAQVRSSADTAFLTRFGSTWKVLAAGCTPQARGPYDCDVEGG